jgi:YfiR/HmsC-like
VEWPSQAFNTPGDPFAVRVLGEDPFERALVDFMRGKALTGRPVQIRRVPSTQQGSLCQILFISTSERKGFQPILADLKSSPVLTVGDTKGFAEAGGVANFALDGETIRIEINVEAAKQKNLLIGSKLLNLARIVN